MLRKITRKAISVALPYVYRPRTHHRLSRLGSRIAGWTVPLDMLDAASVCYSFGAGEDITFDLALSQQTGANVHIFDPTPRAIAHVRSHGTPLITLHEIGVWSEDTTLMLYEPKDPRHVSHSATNLQQTSKGFVAQVKTVRSIAKDLGHERVDLIKMDIEGAEESVLTDLIAHGPMPRVLCVEFDMAAQGGIGEHRRMALLVRLLADRGVRLAHIENWNFLFHSSR